MCSSTDDRMEILDDVIMTPPLYVHVMSAGGRLPPWMQKKRTVEFSSTVWLSGFDK